MSKRPRAHRTTTSDGSAGGSIGSGSNGGNGGGSAGSRRGVVSQWSTTMSTGAADEEGALVETGRSKRSEAGDTLDYYESGSDDESRSSSSKRRRSSYLYEQNRSRADDTTASLLNADVEVTEPPLTTTQARTSTSTLIQERDAEDRLSPTVPQDTTPQSATKESCDLSDWEALKVLFVRAMQAFDNDPGTDYPSQSASTLLHAVLTECNRFLTFYRDPSVLFVPGASKKDTKGSTPNALTPPDVRLRRDWGVGSGSSSSGSGSSWQSHTTRGHHTDEEVSPLPSATVPVAPIATEKKTSRKRHLKKKYRNNDPPTAFHTLYGTALLLYGILVSRSTFTQGDVTETQLTAQDSDVIFSSAQSSPLQTISPAISSPSYHAFFSSLRQEASQPPASPRHFSSDPSIRSRTELGTTQILQRPSLVHSQVYVRSPMQSMTASPSGDVSTPSVSSAGGLTGTASTSESASNMRPASSRTSSSASASTPPSSYFSLPFAHDSPTWTRSMPLIPATRSALSSPAAARQMAQKRLLYPPSYYWLAALDVFATGETIVSERARLGLTSRHLTSSDMSATVHDPFFSPTKYTSGKGEHHHHHHHHHRHHHHHQHESEMAFYEYPSNSNPFRTSFSALDTPRGQEHLDLHSRDAKPQNEGVFEVENSEYYEKTERKRLKRKRGEREKEKEDWRLPLGWGRTLVCLADEKASEELRERERLLATSSTNEGISDEVHVTNSSALPVPQSFFGSSWTVSNHHEAGSSSSFSPTPVTVTTPNGSTKNMASSQTPSSRRAQLLRESAHHLLVLSVDQFTRGMLHMPRNAEQNEEQGVQSNVSTESGGLPVSPSSPAGSTPLQPIPESSPPSSPLLNPPSLSNLLPYSRTQTLVTIADAVLDVAAKLTVPDDRAHWGRWVNGILDVDEHVNTSSIPLNPSVEFSSSGSIFGSLAGSTAIPSQVSTTSHSDATLDQSAAGKLKAALSTSGHDVIHSQEQNPEERFLNATRSLAKARAWILMGTAINEGTSERVRKSEEREAKEALQKAVELLEDCLLKCKNMKSTIAEDAVMSTSSSGETVTQEDIDKQANTNNPSPPSADADRIHSIEHLKAQSLSLEKNSRNLLYDTYFILSNLVDESERESLLTKALGLEAFLSNRYLKTTTVQQAQREMGSEMVSMECDESLPDAY